MSPRATAMQSESNSSAELAHRRLVAQVDEGNALAVPRQAEHIAEIVQIR
jgi:hypothetical protein